MIQEEEKAWRCGVCGYVHRQAAPPDCCPVCGAAGELFEVQPPQAPDMAAAPAGQWRCLNCTYVHEGSEPPEQCPVCGAPRDRMEAVTSPAEFREAAKGVARVVVVGTGIAGISAAEAIDQASPDTEIILVSKETCLPYYRLNLTRYLAGEIGSEHLPIHPEAWYQRSKIQLRTGVEVSGILPAERTILLHGGEKIPYDKLILTVGSHPFLPPFPGVSKEGVTALRTLADGQKILNALRPGARCVCIGGGILGLEAAAALVRRGVTVTLVEGHGWLLPRQLNERGGRVLEAYVKGLGIELQMGAQTAELVGDERVAGVQLKDGRVLAADLIVVTAGVRPNSYLARLAGLEVNQGIVVDNHLGTSHPDILAAGDVAEHRGVLYGVWAPAQFQGNIAGLNSVGARTEFGGIPKSNTLKVVGVELFSIGKLEPEDASYAVIDQETAGGYHRFVFRDSFLVGAILIGDARLSPAIHNAIGGKRDFSGLLARRPGADAVAEFLQTAQEH